MLRKMKGLLKKGKKIRIPFISVILPMFILGVFLLVFMMSNVHTKTYEIERFSQAKETIRSPITIENEQETMRKTHETIQAVEDIYNISEQITEERIQYVEEIFDAVEKIENEHKQERESESNGKIENGITPATIDEKIQQFRQILSSEIVEKISERILINLIEASPAERKRAKEMIVQSLSETFSEGVRKEDIEAAKREIQETVYASTLNFKLKETLVALSNFAVVENSFFDPEATSSAHKEAASSVEPVVIRAGDVIVREGQIITNQIYEELKLAGLLNEDRSIYPMIGLIILIFLIVSVIGYEMNIMSQDQQLDKGKIISIVVISIIVVSLMKIVSLYTTQTNQLYFAVPVATGALLLKLLINERTAIVLSILYAIIGCVIFNGEIPGSLNVEAGIYFFFSQLAAIVFLLNVKDRLAIVRAGIGMTVMNILTILLFVFLSIEKYTVINVLILISFGLGSALLSAILTSGLLPFFETSLGILSDIKLLSLANPNHPLLRKLLIEAPGTYHHSIMVANLSETACEAIGANGLLARVGAYYHDIGKTTRPHYFIENQLSVKNPHDLMKPRESAHIIIKHPYDGAEMLKKHKMPKELVDIALQHHGTSLLKYFYYQEKKSHEGVKEEDYRYPGPKPQTREAAIICICDAVEAAVRSLTEPTEQKIDEIVTSIIKDRLMDGQLDETPLTLKDLNNIHSAICETLKGIFHSRIQYPLAEERGK